MESPETLYIDWLFEHTESESESYGIKGNFVHLKYSIVMHFFIHEFYF